MYFARASLLLRVGVESVSHAFQVPRKGRVSYPRIPQLHIRNIYSMLKPAAGYPSLEPFAGLEGLDRSTQLTPRNI